MREQVAEALQDLPYIHETRGRFLGGVNWCNTIEASGIIQIYPRHTPKQQRVPEVLSYQLKEITSPNCYH
ncbi:hypothetical protein TURU_061053 [Turdus rufiventris]|nr:hypothetical protein TURU_061053 [Turdus rufiventris]